MDSGISFEVIWLDESVIEVRVEGTNGRFWGRVDCYAGHDLFSRLAAVVRGFPSSNTDRREFDVGTAGPGYVGIKASSGGGVRLVLHCTDSLGHASLEVRMHTAPRPNNVGSETAVLFIPVDAAKVDDFVAALDRVHVAVGAVARL
jgi:hypothetical protein